MGRLRSCPYCGRIHDAAFDCGQKLRREKKPTKESRFRSRAAWKKMSLDIRQRDAFCCLACKAGIGCSPHPEYHGTEVHHIVALKDDFDKRLDEDNLITLCKHHHEEAEEGKIKASDLRELIKRDRERPGMAREYPPAL